MTTEPQPSSVPCMHVESKDWELIIEGNVIVRERCPKCGVEAVPSWWAGWMRGVKEERQRATAEQ